MLLPAAWLFFIFVSCAGNSAAHIQANIDTIIQTGSFREILALLDSERNSRNRTSLYANPKNEILFYLDRGMIAHYAGLYQESFEDLGTAEWLIEEAFTRSITQDIATFIINDNMRDYSGEDYEDLYVNIFNALNRYHLGDLGGALVEIRRLNEKLVILADKYERAVRKVKSSDRNLDSIDLEASRFSNSALARYMGILFYRTIDNPDSVRIEYEELVRAFNLAPEVYSNPIPSSVSEELSIPAGMARLNIVAFTGLPPIKEERNTLIPLPFPPPNNSARIALPVMVSRHQPVNRVEVVLDSGERFNLELLEDMGAVAKETFKSEYALTVLKSTARAITRTAVGATGAHLAERRGGALAGLAVGIATRVFSEAAEHADTRLSRYFPNNALVGGINLEPGAYMVTVNFYGAGRLIESQRREISVQRSSLNLEQFVNLRRN